MGANVWQKDGESGRTTSVGAKQYQAGRSGNRTPGGGTPGRGRGRGGRGDKPQKRKLVWSRDGNDAASAAAAARTPPLAKGDATNTAASAARSSAAPLGATQRTPQSIATHQQRTAAAAPDTSTDTAAGNSGPVATPAAKRQRLDGSRQSLDLNASALPFRPATGSVATSNLASAGADQSSVSSLTTKRGTPE